MNMIKNIEWFSWEREHVVCYKVLLFTTIHDYWKISKTRIWVHDIKSTSRRKVTLSILSDSRDSIKTMTSTFVKFIHQKDALLAICVVNYLLDWVLLSILNFLTIICVRVLLDLDYTIFYTCLKYMFTLA